jgi:tetratricopeptide (TPR) repeat protein
MTIKVELEQQADIAASQRRFADARALLQRLVIKQPDNFNAWMKLSAMARANGDIEAALGAVAAALKICPQEFMALLLKAILFHALGKVSAAGAAYTRALAHMPIVIPEGMDTMIAAAQQRSRVWLDSDGLQLSSNDTNDDALALAYQELEQGNFQAAAESYADIVNHHPDDFEAWNNLGNAYSKLDNIEGAIAAFEQAIALRPDVSVLYINLSKTLVLVDRLEDRQKVMRQAADYAPHNVEVLTELGLAESAMQNYATAERAYRMAIDLAPEYMPAYLELGLLLENLNRLDALEEMLDYANSCGAHGSVLDFLKAWLFRRQGRFQEALPLTLATPETISPVRRAQLLAEIYDRLGETQRAFECFEMMNRIASDLSQVTKGRKYGDDVQEVTDLLTYEKVISWSQIQLELAPPSPIFILGFPRSGTTLLDTLLMNIPNFHILEELPIMRQVELALGDQNRISNIEPKEAAALRARYFESLQIISPAYHGQVIVDKAPLHMARVPIIHRIFPDAKFVFVERHPCDVVLSCFMANFQLNRAMRHFTTLEGAAELYDKVFESWSRARSLLPMKVHTVRYENMVANLEAEMRPLLQFLGVEWNASVLDNRAAASKREHIRTASYAQVAEPIYNHAAGRWQRYRTQMKPVLPRLVPWATKMKYEI